MSIRKLFYTGLICLILSACSSDIFLVHNGNMPSAGKIAQIKNGQTKEEVSSILGSPSSVSTFGGQSWIYMSSTLKKIAFCKPEEVNRDVLAIRFDSNGRVSEIVKYNHENGRDIAIDSSQTVTAGHKMGFFRKYFGGVGAYMPIAPTGGDSL